MQLSNPSISSEFVFLCIHSENMTFLTQKIQITTSDFAVDAPHLMDDKIDNDLLSALDGADLDDFYTIGLWNYCSGDIVDGKDVVQFCSSFSTLFYFNIQKVWAETGKLQENFPKEVEAGLNIYRAVSKFITASFLLGAISAVGELVLGIVLGFCCPVGVFIVGIVAAISSIFLVTCAITVSAISKSFSVVINKYLDGYGFHCEMGSKVFILLWMAALFSVLAAAFWVFSFCCGCLGKLKKKKKGGKGGKGFHSYERVVSPEHGGYQGAMAYKLQPTVVVTPLGRVENSYEPYRNT